MNATTATNAIVSLAGLLSELRAELLAKEQEVEQLRTALTQKDVLLTNTTRAYSEQKERVAVREATLRVASEFRTHTSVWDNSHPEGTVLLVANIDAWHTFRDTFGD